jgi:hypothetical protein
MSDLHLERLNSKPTAVGPAAARVALIVQPDDPTMSVGPLAVTPVTVAQRSNTDDHLQHASSHAIGQLKHEGALLASNEERRKQIDAILDRMRGSRDRLDRGEDLSHIKRQVDADSGTLVELGNPFHNAADDDQEIPDETAIGSSYGETDSIERARVLRKIEAALKRVGNLKTALSSTDEQSYARLLNINASEAGLAAARVQLGESNFGTISASSTVDALMSNLRAVVIAAHGRMTPELVRLVFP